MRAKNGLITTLQAYQRRKPEVQLAYLFGFQAIGHATRLSDLDVAVMVDKGAFRDTDYPYGYQARIVTELSDLLGTNRIDVVLLNNAPTLLRQQVLTFGKRLFSRDRTPLRGVTDTAKRG